MKNKIDCYNFPSSMIIILYPKCHGPVFYLFIFLLLFEFLVDWFKGFIFFVWSFCDWWLGKFCFFFILGFSRKNLGTKIHWWNVVKVKDLNSLSFYGAKIICYCVNSTSVNVSIVHISACLEFKWLNVLQISLCQLFISQRVHSSNV